MTAYFRFVLRHRVAVLVACGLVTVLALASISRAQLASSIGKLFLAESPDYADYVARGEIFGSDELIVVGFEDPDLLTPEHLARLEEVVERIATLPGVIRVETVLDVQRIRSDDGTLEIRSVVDDASEDPGRTAALWEALRSERFAAGLLVSPHDWSSAVIVELIPDPERTAEEGPVLVAEVTRLLREAGWQDLHRTGLLGTFAEVVVQTRYSLGTLFPFVAMMLLVTVWLLFRRLWPAALALTVSLVGVVWAMGFAVQLDPQINIMMSIVPAVVLIVAFSDVVHLCSAYLLELERGLPKRDAILASARDVGRACLFTSVTTLVGFVSLTLVPTPVFRVMGVVLGFGVAAALVMAMTLAPVLFHYLPVPRPLRHGPTARIHAWFDTVLAAMERLSTRRPWWVIGAFGAVLVLSAIGIARLNIETDFARRLDPSNPVRADQRWFAERFAGSNVLHVFVEVPEADGLLDAELFARIARFQEGLEALPEVDQAISMVDVIEELHRVLAGDVETAGALPTTRGAVAKYLLLFEMAGGEDLDRLVDFDRRVMRILVRLRDDGFRETAAAGARAEALGREILGDSATVKASGMLYLSGRWLEEILAGQRRALVLSFIVICCIMTLGLRSLRLGLWSMVPNLLPLLWLGGWLGGVWEQVDSDALVIALFAIGIGVDDTIHFMMRYRLEAARAADRQEAIRRTFSFAGRAIIMTTVILVVGFLPFATGDYLTVYMIGTLLPSCLVMALLADLLLLPAMVRVGWLEMWRPRSSE